MAFILVPSCFAFPTAKTHVGSAQVANAQTSTFSVGVNYLSLYYEYSPQLTNDTVLNRDFTLFSNSGVKVISLPLFWYRLEPTKGNYDNNFLANVKHVITVANQHGIKVLVDIHTLWGSDSVWCTPSYAMDPVTGQSDGLAIVRNDTVRAGFIAMFTHTIQYLAGTAGIFAWSVLNEPWYWGRTPSEHDFVTSNGQTQEQNFVTLIGNLSNIVKTYDTRPTTVKFINMQATQNAAGTVSTKNMFTSDWNWDTRIFSALSFISFDPYIPVYTQAQNSWISMTTSNIQGCVARSKQVWIAEFGYSSDSDATQTSAVTTSVALFKTLPVQGWIAWFWEGDVAPKGYNQTPGVLGKGFNLCATANGTPRPAFYKMMP